MPLHYTGRSTCAPSAASPPTTDCLITVCLRLHCLHLVTRVRFYAPLVYLTGYTRLRSTFYTPLCAHTRLPPAGFYSSSQLRLPLHHAPHHGFTYPRTLPAALPCGGLPPAFLAGLLPPVLPFLLRTPTTPPWLPGSHTVRTTSSTHHYCYALPSSPRGYAHLPPLYFRLPTFTAHRATWFGSGSVTYLCHTPCLTRTCHLVLPLGSLPPLDLGYAPHLSRITYLPPHTSPHLFPSHTRLEHRAHAVAVSPHRYTTSAARFVPAARTCPAVSLRLRTFVYAFSAGSVALPHAATTFYLLPTPHVYLGLPRHYTASRGCLTVPFAAHTAAFGSVPHWVRRAASPLPAPLPPRFLAPPTHVHILPAPAPHRTLTAFNLPLPHTTRMLHRTQFTAGCLPALPIYHRCRVGIPTWVTPYTTTAARLPRVSAPRLPAGSSVPCLRGPHTQHRLLPHAPLPVYPFTHVCTARRATFPACGLYHCLRSRSACSSCLPRTTVPGLPLTPHTLLYTHHCAAARAPHAPAYLFHCRAAAYSSTTLVPAFTALPPAAGYALPPPRSIRTAFLHHACSRRLPPVVTAVTVLATRLHAHARHRHPLHRFCRIHAAFGSGLPGFWFACGTCYH